MASVLSKEQLSLLETILTQALDSYEVMPSISEEEQQAKANAELLQAYLSAKKIEGCSEKTIGYYQSTIDMCVKLQLTIYATIYPTIKSNGKSVG